MFFTAIHFQPCLILQARLAPTKVEPFWVLYCNGRLLALPANIRQMVAGTNTLAYYDTATITVKSLIAQTRAGVKTEHNFKNHAVNACSKCMLLTHTHAVNACS